MLALRNHISRRTLSLVAIAALLMCTLSACPGSNPITTTVGDVLTQYQNTLDSTLAAIQNVSNVELQAVGAEVQIVLDNAKSSMEDVLNVATNDVDKTVQDSLAAIGNLVNNITTDTISVIHQALMATQQLVNSLPLTNKNPQVSSYDPSYAAPQDLHGQTVPVTVHGNFVYAYQKKTQPQLTWPGAPTPLMGAAVTTQVLSFDVPASVSRLSHF